MEGVGRGTSSLWVPVADKPVLGGAGAMDTMLFHAQRCEFRCQEGQLGVENAPGLDTVPLNEGLGISEEDSHIHSDNKLTPLILCH